jgi:plastocyanin
MKFLKQKNISKFSITDQTLFANQYGRAVINLTGAVRLPKGSSAQRTDVGLVRTLGGADGFIRYNTDIDTVTQEPIGIEVYVNGIWEAVPTDEAVKNYFSRIITDIVPRDNETNSLGTDTNRWKDLYIGPGPINLGDIILSEEDNSLKIERADSTIASINVAEINNGVLTLFDDTIVSNDDIRLETSSAGVIRIISTITGADGVSEPNIVYDNSGSRLTSTSVQSAIDELADSSGDAENIKYDPTATGFQVQTVQEAIDELFVGVASSSLTSVGALESGSIVVGFGNINIGTNTFTGDGSGVANVDALALNGQSGAHYLEYTNFTNAPVNVSDFFNDKNYIALTDLSAAGDLNYNVTTGEFSVTTYKSTDFDTDFAVKSTNDLAEGNNLYFRTDRIDSHLSGSTGVTYNTGVISIGQDVATTSSVTFSDITSTGTISGTVVGDGSGVTNVDALTLNGQSGTHYLEYTNFTNAPTNVSAFTNDENYIKLTSLSAAGDLSYNVTSGEFSVTTYKSSDFNTDFAAKSTNDLSEGNNLYFTTGRIDSHLSGGTGVTYNAGVISIGQEVATTSNVTFNNITSTGTISGTVVGDGSGLTSVGANNVTYDNTSVQLTSTDVQDAIDELATALGGGANNFAVLGDASSANLTVDRIFLPAITTLVVGNSGSTAYLFDQYSGNNPTIYAISGTTIAFRLEATGHPFLIQDNSDVNFDTGLVHVTTSGVVTSGSAAQANDTGTLYWKVPFGISGNYKYKCLIHGVMTGTIVVKNFATI